MGDRVSKNVLCMEDEPTICDCFIFCKADIYDCCHYELSIDFKWCTIQASFQNCSNNNDNSNHEIEK